MSEQLPENSEGHPILAGLAALAGVAVVVGLVLGLVVAAGTSVLGLGGDGEASTSTSERSMYLPKPQKTPTETAPQYTLAPVEGGSHTPTQKPSSKPTESASPRKQITLSASTTTSAPMEQFDLTGVYPSGEGAILQVQRFEGGAWADFNATGSVSGGTFQIPIYTSQPGVNRFRVVDSDTQLESNEIRITIG
ncbi:hypothetical protein [Nocardioides pyridinolyticus]